jgi:hypothetical protein
MVIPFKKNVFLFFLLFSLIFHVQLVFGVSFEVGVTPISLEGGKTNQLLNFSLNNTGIANVTEVNISLPKNFIHTQQNFGTSITTDFTTSFSSSYMKWINGSATGLFDNTTLQYFWIYVDTPPSLGTFNFAVHIMDVDGLENSTNVTISLYDITPPQYSQNVSYPSSPVTYSPGKKYWFNISWTDNIVVDKVLFEQNFTTLSPTLENISLSNESSIYFYNINDLPAGTYFFRWYANDTNNTFNSTPQFIYRVNKAISPINMSFNTTFNNNITITNASTLIINVNAIGTITLYKDGTSVAVGTNSLSYDTSTAPLYSTNLFNFTATVTETQNYSTNSLTYFVMVVPSYTISTSIPNTYSSALSKFNISFSSAPGLDSLFLENNFFGSTTQNTMTNYSLNSYSYTINLPAGSFNWQIFGKYSTHTFNLTSLNTFTIQKATPSLSLTAKPSWSVYLGNQTNVSCSSPHVSVNLYRDGVKVNNPDVQTFTSARNYVYICNATGTQNYTSRSITSTLIVYAPAIYVVEFTFTKVENLIYVTQNSSNSTLIKVKNTGNKTQSIEFNIEGIDSSWYSINETKVTLNPDQEAAFLVNFIIGNIKTGNYSGKFKVNSSEKTITSDFTLKVLATENLKFEVINVLAIYKQNYTSLSQEINEIKKEGYNTTLAESKLSQLKNLIDQVENYIKQDDYSSAKELFSNIGVMINETYEELKSSKERGKIVSPLPSWFIYVAIAAVLVIIGGIIAYLFWPTKEIEEVKKEVVPEKTLTEERKSMWEKLKKKIHT